MLRRILRSVTPDHKTRPTLTPAARPTVSSEVELSAGNSPFNCIWNWMTVNGYYSGVGAYGQYSGCSGPGQWQEWCQGSFARLRSALSARTSYFSFQWRELSMLYKLSVFIEYQNMLCCWQLKHSLRRRLTLFVSFLRRKCFIIAVDLCEDPFLEEIWHYDPIALLPHMKMSYTVHWHSRDLRSKNYSSITKTNVTAVKPWPKLQRNKRFVSISSKQTRRNQLYWWVYKINQFNPTYY